MFLDDYKSYNLFAIKYEFVVHNYIAQENTAVAQQLRRLGYYHLRRYWGLKCLQSLLRPQDIFAYSYWP